MASIETQIKLVDNMSKPLDQINDNLEKTIKGMENVDKATEQAFETSKIEMSLESLEKIINKYSNLESEINKIKERQENLNDTIKNGVDLAKKLSLAYAGIKTALNIAKKGFDEFVNQNKIETTLKTVLNNTGATKKAFTELIKEANKLQSSTMFASESMLAGASEIATYINDPEAIKKMMGTLSNYATGMSGGAEVDSKAMTDYATQLGKALDGQFDGLAKKGFTLTEAQEKIIKNGSDMQKALVLDDVINQSWANLANVMAQTLPGKIAQLKNSFNGMYGEFGEKLSGVVMNFVDILSRNMPVIIEVFERISSNIINILQVISLFVEPIINIFSFMLQGFSLLEPVIWGIIGVLGIYNGTLLLTDLYTKIVTTSSSLYNLAIGLLNASTRAQTIAQYGLNAAILQCPIFWIVAGIIAIISIIYAVIGVINKWKGTTISATGVICGVISGGAAVIGNIFIGLINGIIIGFISLWNMIVSFAEFFAKVFDKPVRAIADLFASLLDTIVNVVKNAAKTIDKLLNSNISGAIEGFQNNVKSFVESKIGENKIKLEKANVDDYLFKPISIQKSFNKGYEFGKGIDSKVKSFFEPKIPKIDIPAPPEEMNYGMVDDDLKDKTGKIADNTGKMAKGLDMAVEDLEYLNKLAEREAINKYTTAEIKVEMVNNNTVNNNTDLDGIIEYFSKGIEQAIELVAEGV